MSEAPFSILNIEDDEAIARVVATLLGRAGYRVVSVGDGREALRVFHEERPDLVILDLGLPSLDGWAVIERLRDLSAVPILVLTARDSEFDTVRGLRSGADDYLTKPFRNAELVARVEALLRRRPPEPAGGDDVVSEHGIVVDFGAHRVSGPSGPLELTPTEYRLLEALLRKRGQVVSPEELLRLAWRDPTATGPERVKFAVLRLRRKLGWDAASSPIETVRGFGYRYRPPS